MQLTTELVKRFIGGQMEIQNPNQEYLYRGEIKLIVVEEGDLKVVFSWLAKGEGFPPIPKKWVKDDMDRYAVSLVVCSVSDIGSGPEDEGSRICLQAPILGEIIVLYPPDGSKLDPSKVEGLEISRAQ
jgi:hypothetical protein